MNAEQLERIETIAHNVRRNINDRFRACGLILADEYGCLFDPDVSLQSCVSLMTNGPVEAKPNLARRGERLAGVIEWLSQTPYIYYEEYDLNVRQRFSIAHELGHFILHASLRADCACKQSSVDPQDDDVPVPDAFNLEREADAFAAAFLLPVALVRADIIQFGLCVSFLSARYRVSEPAMRRRLTQMDV